jgi:hypothetical protein
MNTTKLKPELYFEDKSPEPGLHALIVGVSAYTHLKEGTEVPGEDHLLRLSQKLGQLSGPAQSAKDMADFLVKRRDKLTKPLRSLQLLASPSATERANGFRETAPSLVLPANAGNLVDALKAWRVRAGRSDDEVALFYFSGHGSQISRTNALLLLEDYLGGATIFDRTIEVDDIWCGMGISQFVAKIARTQFYFIDCCRVDFQQFRGVKRKTCSPWDTEELGSDGRTAAPVFFAAGPGLPTKALPEQETTRFGKRLIHCLGGGGAVKRRNKWVVTIGQLSTALDKLSKLENLKAGTEVDSFEIDRWKEGETIIHTVDETPKTSCTFRFQPSHTRKGLTLILDNFTPSPMKIPPELQDPHEAEIAAGVYRISSDRNGAIPSHDPIPLDPPAMEIVIEENRVWT